MGSPVTCRKSGSTEGIDILWLEEAHHLTQEQWKSSQPTIRKRTQEIWIIFSPNQVTGFVYQDFVAKPPERRLRQDDQLEPKSVSQ